MCLCSVPCIYAHKWPNTALLTLDSHTHTSTLTQQLLHARISYSICMDKRVSMHGFATELSGAVAWSIAWCILLGSICTWTVCVQPLCKCTTYRTCWNYRQQFRWCCCCSVLCVSVCRSVYPWLVLFCNMMLYKLLLSSQNDNDNYINVGHFQIWHWVELPLASSNICLFLCGDQSS